MDVNDAHADGATSNEEGSNEVVEEDWSIFKGDLSGFASHEEKRIFLPARSDLHDDFIDISCVSSLSPIDMLNLSNGTEDATCHRVWMGAIFFIEALRHDHMSRYFEGDVPILELGSGTGISGIAILKTFPTAKVTMTDGSLPAVELTRSNRRKNLHETNMTHPESLDCSLLPWGQEGVEVWLNEEGRIASFGIIVATDVLYDIGALRPLLETASHILKLSDSTPKQKHFILAHVPRAVYPNESVSERLDTTGDMSALEAYIVKEASAYALQICNIIRPLDLVGDNVICRNGLTVQDFQGAGAAILVFQYG